MGAWIEIVKLYEDLQDSWSLLSWERGLKYLMVMQKCLGISVAPLVGAWIEIIISKAMKKADEVAPLVGAWIEIEPSGKAQ